MDNSKKATLGLKELESFIDQVERNIDVKYNFTLGKPFLFLFVDISLMEL